MSVAPKVLLIDDDEDDFILIRDLLNEAWTDGVPLTWASSYEDGLKVLPDGNFDVALLDYRLGDHTGMELLTEARARGVRVPIILLTGFGDKEVDLQAMKAGAADYLVKNQLTAPLLERSIRYSLNRKNMQAQILASDRLASLGLLASSMAHEIGNPLGVIRGRAEMLIRQNPQSENLKNDMGTIIKQIDRVTKLVQSLLHLASGGKMAGVVGVVSVADVVSDVMNVARFEFDKKGISVEVAAPPELTVMAEAGPLGQVVLNLMMNALHAIESARPASPRLSVRAQAASDKMVEIVVEDNGCGIAPENIPHLFKPFFSTKPVGQGTGLGLAISYQIVHSWGGQIQVKSRLGEGTSFLILIPKANRPALSPTQ